MAKHSPPLEVIVGILLLLILGASALLLAPRRDSLSVAAAPSALATEVATVEVPTVEATPIPTTYSNDPRAIPANPHAAATAYATDCGPDWYTTTNQDVLYRCSELKTFALGVEEEHTQTAIAAVPTFTSLPTSVWDGTPGPTSPSDSARGVIERMKLRTSPNSRPYEMRAVLDAWYIGAVLIVIESGDTVVYRAVLASFPGCILRTGVEDVMSIDELAVEKYRHTWTCPQPIGDLTITNVTGIDGIVTFVSTTGTTGTLDMATGEWQLNDPVVTTTAVEPTVVVEPTP